MYINTHIKYRPTSLSEFVFEDESVKNIIDSYVNGNQTIPIILYGSYGTGKSLLAELIPKAIERGNVQVNKIKAVDLNSSKEVYKQFGGNKQFNNLFTTNNQKFNYNIIEEVNFDPKAKGAFRTVLDDYEGTDLTIITTNELYKIDKAIRSRSHLIKVNAVTPEKFLNKAEYIFKQEGLNINSDILLKTLQAAYRQSADNRNYYKKLDAILQAAD